MNDYLRWLRAAYHYYWGDGTTILMPDREWDLMARSFFENRAKYPPDQYPVLHRKEFTGGSIFWLRPHDYPEDVKS